MIITLGFYPQKRVNLAPGYIVPHVSSSSAAFGLA